jgi:hypothetical protein
MNNGKLKVLIIYIVITPETKIVLGPLIALELGSAIAVRNINHGLTIIKHAQ